MTVTKYIFFSSISICLILLLLHNDKSMITARPRRTTSAPTEDPSNHLNKYCNYTVANPENPTQFVINVQCRNDPDSPFRDNLYTGLHPISFFQNNDGAMSRAVEGAIRMVKNRFSSKQLRIRVDVNGYHPSSHTYRSGKTVAVIDVSNKLANGLGETDEVEISVEQAGLRVDPKFDSRKVKVIATGGVVIVKWNYVSDYSNG